MEQFLLTLADKYGVWAVLTIALIYYTFKQNEKREAKYCEIIAENQSVLKDLTNKLTIVCAIKSDVEEIKDKLNV